MNMNSFVSQIRLVPLNEYNKIVGQPVIDNSNVLLLPVCPSDLMFTESSDAQTIKLMNYGELPVGINRKLAPWTVSSFFPARHSNNFKYWFDLSNGNEDPYDFYCKKIFDWKINETVLVFMFKTWSGYYNCQIKDFKYGRKDASGNIYYEIQFQEYRRLDLENTQNNVKNDSYEVKEGENILQIAKKVSGDSDYYKTILSLNGMVNPMDIKTGQKLKIR